MRQLYIPESPTSNVNEYLCDRLQIDQMSIKFKAAVHTPKSDFKIQMATSVCVSDLIQIDQMSIII